MRIYFLNLRNCFLFWPAESGGLGLVSIKQKANAFLTRIFMEVAANPDYQSSQYLNSLYRFHVLGDDFLCPPQPPYYSATFFDTIRQAKIEGKNIVGMSTRQWYLYLMEREVLKEETAEGSRENRLCRIERKYPEYDWVSTWEKARLPVLSSNVRSFLWKLIHDMLTTEERLNSTLGNIPASCRYGCEDHPVADQIHSFFNCSLTCIVGQWLLKSVRIFGPISKEDAFLVLSEKKMY